MAKRNASHHEAVNEETGPMPSETSTGFVFAAVFLIFAIVFRNDPIWFLVGLGIAGVFGALSVFSPASLSPLNRAWFSLAIFLNRVISPVVMLVIYCVAIVPFGLALQWRSDPLRRRKPGTLDSYWISKAADRPSSMTDQF